ncbi:MAG: hypothetical protein JSR77_00845 [Planctomycetes bacterium]|nr:hypothetical protein [Planctomycetota bacterium]
MSIRVVGISCTFGVVGLTGLACGQLVDTRIPLNYNFHGMAHSGAVTLNADEWTTVANNSLGDIPKGYRSISDRGLIFDPANNHSLAYYSEQNIGNTGISYAFFDTLGYGGTTAADPELNALDLVHLGSRCTGFAPATIWAYEAAANPATNVGTPPGWNDCNHTNSAPQTTTFSPIAMDGGTEIGVLYHASNATAGGQFDVVLGFSDHASITVRLVSPDWYGIPANPAVLANQPVSSQGKIGHTVGGTTYRSFQGADNNDAPVIRAFLTNGGGPNLNVMEGVISVPRIIAGVGTFPATPDIVGAHLTSLTFQNATYPASGGRAYAIFAATVRTGQPQRANCATPQAVTSGQTMTDNIHTFGATPTACGGTDTSAVYYQYTATSTGMIEARTCGAPFDTTIAIYSTCGGQAVACNDDACGTASRVQWSAEAGGSYLIRVAGKAGATGAFTLTIDDPLPTYVSVPLNYNWNGLVHGAAEQGTANKDNLNGYRSIADRGLRMLSGAANGIDTAPLVDADFMPFALVTEPARLDIVHLGDRRFVANAARNWGSGTTQGLQPSWLTENDQTVPQVTDVSSLHAVLTGTSRLGVIYQVSDFGGRFDTLLTFTDGSSTIVTMRAPDWFGNVVPPAPVAGSGLLAQRQLGVYAATQNADVADTTTNNLNVAEAVISVASLRDAGFGDFTGKELQSITFQNPVTNANYANSTLANASGYAILAATLRDVVTGAPCPADFNQDGGVDGADVESFFAAWENADPSADVNQDGGIDGADVSTFFQAWEAGGCG